MHSFGPICFPSREVDLQAFAIGFPGDHLPGYRGHLLFLLPTSRGFPQPSRYALPASIRPLSSTSPAPDVAVWGCLVGAGADVEAVVVGPGAGEVRSLPPAAGTTSPRPDRKGSGPRWFVSVQACCTSSFCPSGQRVLSSSISASAMPSTTLAQLGLPCFSGTKV